jgi:hypothetical protein
MKILAIDLGKYNSLACLFSHGDRPPEYETIGTHRDYIEQLLAKTQPEVVVMETCSITDWVHDTKSWFVTHLCLGVCEGRLCLCSRDFQSPGNRGIINADLV